MRSRLLTEVRRLGLFLPPNQEVDPDSDDHYQNSADQDQAMRHGVRYLAAMLHNRDQMGNSWIEPVVRRFAVPVDSLARPGAASAAHPRFPRQWPVEVLAIALRPARKLETMSEIDQAVVAPEEFEGDPEEAARKLYAAGARATDTQNLQSPIQMRLLDGHGNEVAAYVIAVNEQGNVTTVLRGANKRELDEEGIFAGLFLVLMDRAGSTRKVKLIIQGRTGPN